MPARHLLRLLLLLLGSFYLNTVCQTDAEDARAYYARGIAEYVAAPVQITVSAPVVCSAKPPRGRAAVIRRGTPSQRHWSAWACSVPTAPFPRARRWLWCAVLQV
ncbi:hypothetical protein [Hymenobacter rubidus]|uniref:hypothetical protein n=1 Tax=Hymenobacter rubidus TaxID=1441626 RepID=UPI00191E3BC0|nr:hypothetical protein [Hymenobacter rubidus]